MAIVKQRRRRINGRQPRFNRRLFTEHLERRMMLAGDVITDYQVYDINASGPPAVSDVFHFGNKLYYQDVTPETGTEIFSLDLTTGVASLVADINPGAASSQVGDDGDFVAIGSKLYFSAFDVAHGMELRVLDTSDNTVSVIDINPGPDSSNPGEYGRLIANGDKIYFSAFDEEIGNELRVFDTTDQSLVSVDINVGAGSSFTRTTGGFAAIGNKLYFGAQDATIGSELRILDTSDNSFVSIDIYAGTGSSQPGRLGGFVASGNQLYFDASEATVSSQLRVLDTTDNSIQSLGLQLTLDPDVGLQLDGTSLMFTAEDDAFGREPRILDTTDNSITTIDVRPGTSDSRAGEARGFFRIGTTIYFVDPGATFPDRLLGYDTATQILTELASFPDPGSASYVPPLNPDNFLVVGSKLYFSAFDWASGTELYVLDSVDDSITIVDLFEGDDVQGLVNSSNAGRYGGFTVVGDQVYFRAATGPEDYGIFRLDTASSLEADPGELPPAISKVADLYSGNDGSDVGTYEGYAVIGTKVFSVANDYQHGTELRQIDLADGSITTFDIRPGPASAFGSEHGGLIISGTKLFFMAADPTFGSEVRVLDTIDNSIETIDINAGPGSSAAGQNGFALIGNRLFFGVEDGFGTSELWELNTLDLTLTNHDLSEPTTVLAGGAGTSGDVSFTGAFYVHGTKVFFLSGNSQVGRELGVLDTTDNSFRLVDIFPGPSSSDLDRAPMLGIGDRLYLSGRAPGGRLELQIVDLTDYSVKTVLSPGASIPRIHGYVGDQVFFEGNGRLHALDTTDDSVSEIGSGLGPLGELAVIGTDVFYSVGLVFSSNEEIMKLDTVDGSLTLFDINEGPDGSDPFGLSVINGMLYFIATTRAGGQEPMILDPSSGIFTPLDIFSGIEGSQTGESDTGREFGGFALAGDTVVFEARVPDRGRELVAMPVADNDHCFAFGNLFITNEDVDISCQLPSLGETASVVAVADTIQNARLPEASGNVGVPLNVELGVVTVTAGGMLIYAPHDNLHGQDSFALIVDNGDGTTSEYSVFVEVKQVNDPGIFGGDILKSASGAGFATGALTFTDPIDGSTAPHFTITPNQGPANGSAFIDPVSGAWFYFSPIGFQGIDTFSVTVTDDDGNPESQVVSVGVGPVAAQSLIVDSSTWSDWFRDFADGGFNDGFAEGYRVLDGSQQSLPWIGLDRIKIPFNVDVGDSLDVDDFVLTGDSGFDTDFASGVVPGIDDFDWDSETNTVTLRLNSPLGPNRYILTVLADGIESFVGQTLLGDPSYTIFVLPGDSVDENASATEIYSVDGADSTFVRNAQSGFLFDGPGSGLLDGSYFGYDIRADLNGDAMIDGVDATAIRDRVTSFIYFTAELISSGHSEGEANGEIKDVCFPVQTDSVQSAQALTAIEIEKAWIDKQQLVEPVRSLSMSAIDNDRATDLTDRLFADFGLHDQARLF